MAAPENFDRILQTCNYRFQTVLCPEKKKSAEVTAAKWQVSNENWTKWTVVDCSLLPAGEVWCQMACLVQSENVSKQPPERIRTKKN